MAEPVHIKDNARNEKLSLTEEQWNDLSFIAGRKVKELCDQENDSLSLLVFPNSLDVWGDKISDSSIIEIKGETVSTGNLMGFIGCRGTKLRIHSRFDYGENDYFMHYLLEKVFSINLFDLKYNTDSESVFDFVLFLFPFFLKKALSQGLYKEYVTRQYNDDRVRGVVEVSRHIRLNIPFAGKVAYKTREHTADNNLLELIRHTVEYIRSKEFGAGILSRDEETKSCVSLVVDATPSYVKNERARIISNNLRTRIHPYYSEYEPLRKLCIQILRQEEIKYGKDDDTVYGVLFDGAWLWEEYLNTILENLGFNHPENRLGRGAIHMFVPKHGARYPDFYNDWMVLDAKYKRYGEDDKMGNPEDLAQVVSYMYIKKFLVGGFLVPGGQDVQIKEEELHGYGGRIIRINLPIPGESPSYDTFCEQMAKNEDLYVQAINGFSSLGIAL